jgi:sugar phosphate isomerase/epimerase
MGGDGDAPVAGEAAGGSGGAAIGAPAFAANTYAYMLSMRAEAAMDRLARQGFRDFELMAHPGHLWPPDMDAGARRGFRRTVADAGLRLVSLNMANVDLNIASTFPEMRAYSLDILEKLIFCAGDLGIPGVVVTPGKPNVLMPAPRNVLVSFFLAALKRLGPLARAAGTSLWLENVPFSFLPDAASSMQALDAFGDPSIGYVYDLANAHFIAEDAALALGRIGRRLRLVHASDTGRDLYRHAPIGQGSVDWQSLPRLMADCAYASPIVLEIVSDTPDADICASRAALEALPWDEDHGGDHETRRHARPG